MTIERLPVRFDPLRSARRNESFSGEIPLHQLERLTAALLTEAGRVSVSLRCREDLARVAVIEGEVAVAVVQQCQRCLQPYHYALESRFVFGVVPPAGSAERLDPAYEPLWLEEDSLFVADLVEEELILALPLVPLHPEGSCQPEWSVATEPSEESERVNHPFAVLRTR